MGAPQNQPNLKKLGKSIQTSSISNGEVKLFRMNPKITPFIEAEMNISTSESSPTEALIDFNEAHQNVGLIKEERNNIQRNPKVSLLIE